MIVINLCIGIKKEKKELFITLKGIIRIIYFQLKCMTDYIVAEGIQLEKDKAFGLANHIANRLSFLENCIRATDVEVTVDIAKHLMNRPSSSRLVSFYVTFLFHIFIHLFNYFFVFREGIEMSHKLLVQLYMRIPSFISHLKESEVLRVFSKYASISGTYFNIFY